MVEERECKSTIRSDIQTDYSAYYARTRDRPPRATLLRALDAFAAEGRSPLLIADLGCGTGRDGLEMLRRGHRVVAVDREEAALKAFLGRVPQAWRSRLHLVCADLRSWIPPPADLVNASFVLFTLEREEAALLLARVRRALSPGGRFAGHLLGPGDSWVREGRCFGVERGELAAWFSGMELEWLEEERCRAVTPRGRFKWWHLWHIVARKVHEGESGR